MKISDLNNKWWFRLLKVIYVGFFFILGIVILFSVYEQNITIYKPALLITCDYGNHSVFNSNKIQNYNPEWLEQNPDVVKNIDTICATTPSDLEYAQAQADAYNAHLHADCNNGITGIFGSLCNINIGPTTYEVNEKWLPVNNVLPTLYYMAISLILLVFVFLLGRVAFYYVALGKFFPKK